MACYSFSIYFCALSSSLCCIILASSLSLILICYFSSRFCTSSSSSRCSTKSSWAYLEIAKLSSSGIEMEIVPIIYEESWYTICSEQSCCNIFSTVSFEKLSSSCCNNAAMIASLPAAVWNPSLMDGIIWVTCHWPCRWVDGAQCKRKHWSMF